MITRKKAKIEISDQNRNITIPTETIQQWEVECLDFIQAQKLSTRQVLTYMGTFNGLTWRAAADYLILNSDRDESDIFNKSRIIYENLHRVMNPENCRVQYAVEALSKYMKSCWPNTFYAESTMRRMRDKMLSLGLFYFDKENRPKGGNWGAMNGVPNQGTATPPDLEMLNVPKLVVWYQVMHSYLKVKLGCDRLFEMMPEHGGMLMIDMYNTMFCDLKTFAGNQITENPAMIVPEPQEPESFIKKPITWMWRNIANMPKEVWRSLVRRAKEKPEPMKYQSTPWEGVEICDRADFYCEQPVDEFAMEFA